MSYEISLAKLLENRDIKLYGRLLDIGEMARSLLSYTQGKFPYYTPHDFSHSNAVEENLNWLIPDDVKQGMDTFELFFLILSAWLHDWGMVAEANEDAETVRNEHHIRTEMNFESLYDKLRLSEHEGRIIGRISKGHRRVDLSSNEYDDVVFGQSAKIRRRFLAALLRLADECDITHNRTPEVIFFSINPKENAEIEFKKHLSISGVGQLTEAHKIYISAIARDPKGARTLREVAQKVQSELDGVKAILSENNVPLDTVELRLETRGFIDKPISFEMDRARIVQLLIGDHLYANQDVAIRELVQNSLDSCKLRQTLNQSYSCKISLQKLGDGTLVIEDNGLGMDFIEAKGFLSTIGSSFCNSESFRQCFVESEYSPIAQYGIGMLSCFLIADQMIIETYKDGQEPCKFTVESVAQEWRYEKGSLIAPGTQITLKLNEYGQEIKLRESLEKYFLCPEIPIEFSDDGMKFELLHSEWSGEYAIKNFFPDFDSGEKCHFNEILRVSVSQFDLIMGTISLPYNTNMILFNHGIHVSSFDISGLNYHICLCVNMHVNLVDMLLSREDVKKNDKWQNFIKMLFDQVFLALKSKNGDDPIYFIKLMSTMINGNIYYTKKSSTSLFDRIPFVKSFLDHAPFLVSKDGNLKPILLREAMLSDSLQLYNCSSKELSDEMVLIKQLSKKDKLIINPYSFPFVCKEKDESSTTRLLPFLLTKDGKLQNEVDLRTLLLDNASEIGADFSDLLPENVRLATFSKGIHPLVVIKEQPVVLDHCYKLGTAYWGNILLWKQLLGIRRSQNYLKKIEEFYDDRFDLLKLIKEPVVYVDRADTFVKAILAAKQRGVLDTHKTEKVTRYFKYLSYLPLVLSELSSCLIFLEVIDQLEDELSASLKIKRPNQLFSRMKPNCKVFLEYYEKFGLNYMEKNLSSDDKGLTS